MLYSPVAIVVIAIWLIGFAILMIIERTPAALAAGILSGLLFLPQFKFDIPGIPIDKATVLSLAAGGAAFLVAGTYRPVFRLSLADIPMLGLCAACMAASLSNGLGLYDGFVSALRNFILLAIPWFTGKAIYSTHANAIVLVRMTVVAGMVYTPFCLFEMKMAPILHVSIYGYSPRNANDMVHAIRYGFWRPTVFMVIGLQLAPFMGITSILALWGYLSGILQRIANVSTLIIALILGLTTLCCVSSGAILLTTMGWCVVLASRVKAGRVLMLLLAIFPIAYPVYRMTNIGKVAVEIADSGSEVAARQASLNYRIKNEDSFLAKWKERPLLGWTPWYMRDVGEGNVLDAMWIAMLGCYGLLGWACWSAFQFLPVVVSVIRTESQRLDRNVAVVMGLCVLISWMDNLTNGFPTTVYGLMAGAAASFVCDRRSIEDPIGNAALVRNNRPRRVLWPPEPESAPSAR
jgi:hypothetical protein